MECGCLWNREEELAQAAILRNYLPLLRDCSPEAAADLEQDLASRNVSVETGTTLLSFFGTIISF